ncbi:MAG: transposase family protein [Spirochaetaceae bacterium]|nr:transposase family protein [Spirochaetaceae bacterium]
MKQKQAVTRQIRSRYLQAGRKEKSAILDEFIKITGYKNRKYALRILNKPQAPQALLVGNGKAVKLKPQKKRPPNRTGKKIYTDEVITSLHLIWAFFWYKCGKLLVPLMRQQMDAIASWPAFGITADIKAKLLSISPATIDRALKKDKAALALKGKSLTKPGHFLKHRIPIRTFYTSQERKLPGFIQIDTVHHCGQTTSGQYILTLSATDVASGWICLFSLLNKAHRWTFTALKDIYSTLPFPLREFHSDNGSEFINQVITDWHRNPVCPIPFSRSRDHRKNDNCFVEQKNGAVVREYIGYDRLEGTVLQACLAEVYRFLPPLLNFFMPTMKLESKVKVGSKEIKKYDVPRSPYQRLLESEALSSEVKAELTRLCGLYNPVQLQHNVNKAVLALREAVAAGSHPTGREPAA